MYTLHLLGSVAVEGPRGLLTGYPAQPRQLALIALLSTAGASGCTRDKLGFYLWPEVAQHSARHSLADAIYRLRQALGTEAVSGAGFALRLNPDVVRSDVESFLSALEDGDDERAVAAYRGPFLEGFHLGGSAEFERWRETEAHRLAARFELALETLAERAGMAHNPRAAARWWARASAHDRFNTRFALSLAGSLCEAGDRGNALLALRKHADLLRNELRMEVPEDVARLMSDLRVGGRRGRRPRSHTVT